MSTDTQQASEARLGDAARDRQDLTAAAKHYLLHLNANPHDFQIWVQLGHTLGASGRGAEALVAYNTGRGLILKDRDVDPRLSLGHLHEVMKIQDAAQTHGYPNADLNENAQAPEESRVQNPSPTPGDPITNGAQNRTLVAATPQADPSQPDVSHANDELASLADKDVARSHYDIVRDSGLFDKDWYLETNPDVWLTGIDPVSHFLESGAFEGRWPSSAFDTVAYMAKYPELIRNGVNPLVHWCTNTVIADPIPAFTPSVQSLDRFPLPPNDPRYQNLVRAILMTSGLFDEQWYRKVYADNEAARLDPIAHYLENGATGSVDPSPFFDSKSYLKSNPDVAQSGMNPLIHFLKYGNPERRSAPVRGANPAPAFCTLADICDPMRLDSRAKYSDPDFKISVVTPTFDTEPRYLIELYNTLANQIYENWEWIAVDNGSSRADTIRALKSLTKDARVKIILSQTNLGISGGTNLALEASTGTHVALVDHDDLVGRRAFLEAWHAFQKDKDIDLFYTDECKINEDGNVYDFFLKPSWSPVMLENTMYIGHLSIYRRNFIIDLGGFRGIYDGTQDYDLALRASAVTNHVCHLPVIGYIWRAIPGSTASSLTEKSYALQRQHSALLEFARLKSKSAKVSAGYSLGYWRTTYPIISAPPLLSYVIPTGAGTRFVRGNKLDLITNCIQSLEEKEFYTHREYIVVHNGNLSANQLNFLNAVPRCKLVLYESNVFNLAEKINLGVELAVGEFVCLLNDDVEAITEKGGDDIIGFMIAHPDVGAVGPLCLFEDGRVQHNGVVLLEQGPSHYGIFESPSFPGHAGNLQCRREAFGVTGAMMFVRRETYLQTGGFSVDLPLNYNDVDFCQRLRASGLSCVVDPGVVVYHFESATKLGTFKCEKEALFHRWPSLSDPYFNPSFDQRSPHFDLGRRSDGFIGSDPIAFEKWLDQRISVRNQNKHPSLTTLFSVCVSVYDQPRELLQEMYRSILMQTYVFWELIIVDNGSSRTETLDWLEHVRSENTARIIRHDVNRGIAGANRTFLAAAKGEFIFHIDADDFMCVDALEIMARVIDNNPEARALYSDEFKSNLTSDKFLPFLKPDFDPILIYNCCYVSHLMAFRADHLREINAYGDDEATWCHDWDAVFRSMAIGEEPLHVPELLYAWRINPGSTASAETGTKPEAMRSQAYVLNRLITARGLADELDVQPNELGPNTGMWAVHARRDVSSVCRLVGTEIWGEPDPAAIFREAAATYEWIAILMDGGDNGAVRALSALAILDERVCVVSGLVTTSMTRPEVSVLWSGGLFQPDGGILDPYAGTAWPNSGYHGQLYCQRCVDVAAPIDVLIRSAALLRVLGHAGGLRDVGPDSLMVALGVDAAVRGDLVCVNPHQHTVMENHQRHWLPVDRSSVLSNAPKSVLSSRWYNPQLDTFVPYELRI